MLSGQRCPKPPLNVVWLTMHLQYTLYYLKLSLVLSQGINARCDINQSTITQILSSHISMGKISAKQINFNIFVYCKHKFQL